MRSSSTGSLTESRLPARSRRLGVVACRLCGRCSRRQGFQIVITVQALEPSVGVPWALLELDVADGWFGGLQEQVAVVLGGGGADA